eukprot:756498-Hanusia_phi.AAC.6
MQEHLDLFDEDWNATEGLSEPHVCIPWSDKNLERGHIRKVFTGEQVRRSVRALPASLSDPTLPAALSSTFSTFESQELVTLLLGPGLRLTTAEFLLLLLLLAREMRRAGEGQSDRLSSSRPSRKMCRSRSRDVALRAVTHARQSAPDRMAEAAGKVCESNGLVDVKLFWAGRMPDKSEMKRQRQVYERGRRYSYLEEKESCSPGYTDHEDRKEEGRRSGRVEGPEKGLWEEKRSKELTIMMKGVGIL